jgi:hypothetical protein
LKAVINDVQDEKETYSISNISTQITLVEENNELPEIAFEDGFFRLPKDDYYERRMNEVKKLKAGLNVITSSLRNSLLSRHDTESTASAHEQ